MLCSLFGTIAIAQKNKVVILDSITAQKTIFDLIDCDVRRAELKVTKEVLSLNHQVIDRQNEIIIVENKQKAILLNSIKHRDTVLLLQEDVILNHKKAIQKIKRTKVFYQFSTLGLLATLAKILIFK